MKLADEAKVGVGEGAREEGGGSRVEDVRRNRRGMV